MKLVNRHVGGKRGDQGKWIKCSFGVHTHTHTVHISTTAAPHDNCNRNSMQKIGPHVMTSKHFIKEIEIKYRSTITSLQLTRSCWVLLKSTSPAAKDHTLSYLLWLTYCYILAPRLRSCSSFKEQFTKSRLIASHLILVYGVEVK